MKFEYKIKFISSVILCFIISILGNISSVNNKDMTVFEFIISGKCYSNTSPTIYHGISYSLSGSWFSTLLPLLVAIPGLLPYADHMQSGFWRYSIVRVGKKNYIRKCWLSNVVTGSLAVTLGYLLYCAVVLMNFRSVDDKNIYLMNPLCKLLDIQSIFVVIAFKALILMIFSFFTVSICLCMYLITDNKYKAIGMPIIMFYLLSSVSDNISKKSDNLKIQIISPQQLISSSEYWFETCYGVSYWILPISFAALIILLYAAYSVVMKRRLEV